VIERAAATRPGRPDGTDMDALRRALRAQQASDPRRAALQVGVTFALFVGLLVAMYATAHVAWWLTIALAVPAAGLVVRIFILQHDCGHGALFRSKRANDWIGRLCSLATLTPYANWRRHHNGHHAIWNNLDRRESGTDIYSTCLTVAEYRRLSPTRRLLYRAGRHPLVALVLLPPLVFVLLYRLPFDTPADWRRERNSVHLTNLALVGLFAGIGLAFGYGTMAKVQVPVIAFAAIAGVWLFAVQHRFHGAVWLRGDAWSPTAASLRGSSHLRLPQPLRWFSGDIGYHHVHHLNPRIPNYRLAECHASDRTLGAVSSIGLVEGLRASRCWLWDEATARMISFRQSGMR